LKKETMAAMPSAVAARKIPANRALPEFIFGGAEFT
jgi:hypothetical protein